MATDKTVADTQEEVQYVNKDILTALFNFQNAVGNIPKNAKGYGYNYSPLDVVRSTILPLLKLNNLLYRQYIEQHNKEGEGNGIDSYMVTEIIHIPSGQFISEKLLMPKPKADKMNDVQAVGSVITYMRRYGLMLALGIIGEEEDTDANTEKADNKKPRFQGNPKKKEEESYEDKNKKTITGVQLLNSYKLKIANITEVDEIEKLKQGFDKYIKSDANLLNDIQVNMLNELINGKVSELVMESRIDPEEDITIDEMENLDRAIQNDKDSD